MRGNGIEKALHFFFRQIFHLVLGDLGSPNLLWIVDLQSPHLFEVAKKTSESGEYGGHGGWCQILIQKTAFIYRKGLAANLSYRTVTNRCDEFLDMAFVTNERGGSTVIFDPQVVEKGRQHFRD